MDFLNKLKGREETGLAFHYLIAAILQVFVFIFWFMSNVSVTIKIFGQKASEEVTVIEWLEGEDLAICNTLVILFSIVGIVLLVLPMVLPDIISKVMKLPAKVASILDWSALVATFLGLCMTIMCYASAVDEMGKNSSISIGFGVGGILFLLFSVVQLIWIVRCEFLVGKIKKANGQAAKIK